MIIVHLEGHVGRLPPVPASDWFLEVTEHGVPSLGCHCMRQLANVAALPLVLA